MITHKKNILRDNILFIAGIMPLAIVLSFLFLGDKSLWLDETFSITIAGMDWPQFWHVLSWYEANQGFYYFILHFWTSLGQSEFAVRSLSVIFALCSITAVYILSKRFFGTRTGIIAALLITVNAFFITYAQEARGYMLALLLSTLSTYFFIASIEKSGWKYWGAYVICSALGVYTHLYVILVLVAQFASLIVLPREYIRWKSLLVSVAVLLMLLIPMGLFILLRDVGQIGWVDETHIRQVAWLFSQLSGGSIPILIFYFLLVITALFFSFRTFFESKQSIQLWKYTLLLSWLLLPVVISFIYSFIKPIFVIRYFVVILPPLIILVADGINRIKIKWLMFAAVGVILILSSFSLQKWYSSDKSQEYTQKDEWREVTNDILTSAEPGDAIILYFPIIRVPYEYYSTKLEAAGAVPDNIGYFSVPDQNLNLYYLPDGLIFTNDIPDPDGTILDRLEDHERVWLVLGYDNTPVKKEQGQMLQQILQEKYDIATEKEYFRKIRVYLYTDKFPRMSSLFE